MSFVDIYRENENINENSSHNFSHDDFNRENHKNFKSFEINDHRQFKRKQFLNFELITQMLIVENILKNKRIFVFHDKERSHLKSHD